MHIEFLGHRHQTYNNTKTNVVKLKSGSDLIQPSNNHPHFAKTSSCFCNSTKSLQTFTTQNEKVKTRHRKKSIYVQCTTIEPTTLPETNLAAWKIHYLDSVYQYFDGGFAPRLCMESNFLEIQ